MKFRGHTVECEDCKREIAEEDDKAHPDSDEHLCGACSAKRYQEWIKTPCAICGKPLGKGEVVCDEDGESFAHKECGEQNDPDAWHDPAEDW